MRGCDEGGRRVSIEALFVAMMTERKSTRISQPTTQKNGYKRPEGVET